MNEPMHRLVTLMAWESLPAAERAAWGLTAAIPPYAPVQVRRAPPPASVEEKWALYGNSLDLMGWRTAEARGYPPWLLPDGSPIPHGGVDPAGLGVWCGDQSWDPASWRRTPRLLVPRIVDAIAAGDHELAALTMAPLLHFLEDSACLGHLVPNRWFYEMFEPDPQAWPAIHPLFDSVDPPLVPAVPRSLGRSVPELTMRLGLLGEWLYARNRRCFVSLTRAALAGDRDRLRALARPIYQELVDRVAALFHTVWRLGRGEPLADPGPVDLVEVSPWLIHPGGKYGPSLPAGHHLVDGRQVPMEAWRNGSLETVPRGLGMTSFHAVRYLLEPGAFTHFEGAVGFSGRHREGQDPELPVSFVVLTAPVWATQVTSDLRYDPPLREVLTMELQPGAELTPFRLDLGQAQTLLVGIRPEVAVVDGQDRCAFPHVVLAEPRLSR